MTHTLVQEEFLQDQTSTSTAGCWLRPWWGSPWSSDSKWSDSRAERTPSLLAITLLSMLTRMDTVVDSVCALGIALISKPALSPQTWWYLREEALDLISVPLTKSSPTVVLQWWVLHVRGYPEHCQWHSGPVLHTYGFYKSTYKQNQRLTRYPSCFSLWNFRVK